MIRNSISPTLVGVLAAQCWDGEKETEKRDKSDPTFIPI